MGQLILTVVGTEERCDKAVDVDRDKNFLLVGAGWAEGTVKKIA